MLPFPTATKRSSWEKVALLSRSLRISSRFTYVEAYVLWTKTFRLLCSDTIADRHYVPAPQQTLDEAISSLGGHYGIN